MMKRSILYLLVALLVPFFLYFSSIAQEKEDSVGDKNTAAEDTRVGEKKETPADRDVGTADDEKAPSLDRGDDTGKAEEEKSAVVKKRTDRRKKEIQKQPEAKESEIKQDSPGETDKPGGDNLLLVDHEKIKYDRIPGITLKKEEPAGELVIISDEPIADASREKKKSEGIFGNKTKTIAGWGIVVLIFILFAIYSKTRSRKKRRNTVRTITKR